MGQQKIVYSRSWLPACLIFCSAWIPNFAAAWIYPEHRDIAMLAAESLDPERAAVFNQLWEDARFDNEQRLCIQATDTEQTVTPDCIDWAALSAISGDHACSSEQLLETVTDSDWILAVADVSAQLKLDLAEIPVVVPTDQLEITSDLVADSQERYASQANRANRVNALIKYQPGIPVFVKGDTSVPYGRVVELMALLQSAGVDGVGLVTESPEQ